MPTCFTVKQFYLDQYEPNERCNIIYPALFGACQSDASSPHFVASNFAEFRPISTRPATGVHPVWIRCINLLWAAGKYADGRTYNHSFPTPYFEITVQQTN
jgi:hypothetical protein